MNKPSGPHGGKSSPERGGWLEGLLKAESLRGLLNRGFVCSHQGIKIVITYIEVHLVKLLYVITNAFFNFGNVASLPNDKKWGKKGYH